MIFGTESQNLDPQDATDPYYTDIYIKSPPSGSVDDNGDGIDDSLQPTGTLDGAFVDGLTTGSIVHAADLEVTVVDADDPADGVLITVGAGTGRVTLTACGFATIRLDPGTSMVLTCGSVIARVIEGAVDIELENGLFAVSIPAGADATVEDNPDGSYTVVNSGTIDVAWTDPAGVVTVVVPGTSSDITDITPPVVDGAAVPATNEAGWSNDPDVRIDWAAVDPGFSMGPETFTVASSTSLVEGVATYVSPEVCDNQGNCATGQLELKLDLTGPEITLDAPADGSSVRVDDFGAPTCDATDALSGINGECTLVLSDPDAVPGGLIYTATGSASDRAGNFSTASSMFTVITDADAPEIIATPNIPANANGWRNQPVTYSFTCSDLDSGVADCPEDVTVGAEGAAQSFTVTAVDGVGNVATLMVGGINIDRTAPVVSFEGQQLSYSVDEDIVIGCSATDALSGIDVADCVQVDIAALDYATSVGSSGNTGNFTLTATASDLAGNASQTEISFDIFVDQDSLSSVVAQMIPNGGKGANGLFAHLEHANYDSFINQVGAKCCTDTGKANGKLFTAAQATTLIGLARQLS